MSRLPAPASQEELCKPMLRQQLISCRLDATARPRRRQRAQALHPARLLPQPPWVPNTPRGCQPRPRGRAPPCQGTAAASQQQRPSTARRSAGAAVLRQPCAAPSRGNPLRFEGQELPGSGAHPKPQDKTRHGERSAEPLRSRAARHTVPLLPG